MKKEELLIQGGVLGASQQGALEAELFLQENYLFRRNVLNGKVEFLDKPNGRAECTTKSADGEKPAWRPLTQTALNSIIIRAKREQICESGSPKRTLWSMSTPTRWPHSIPLPTIWSRCRSGTERTM